MPAAWTWTWTCAAPDPGRLSSPPQPQPAFSALPPSPSDGRRAPRIYFLLLPHLPKLAGLGPSKLRAPRTAPLAPTPDRLPRRAFVVATEGRARIQPRARWHHRICADASRYHSFIPTRPSYQGGRLCARACIASVERERGGAMDIDDLLAEVAADSTPQESRDLQELTRCWVAERAAPEVLPWPRDLMERVLERISKQIELVEDQTGNMDPKTNFKLIIIQTELERFKFLVRSLLRARIKKIDAHPLHIQSLHTASLETPFPLLSPSEYRYLTSHQALLASHYSSSFLSQFPASLQRLDDTTGGISMVDKPDEDKAVFVRALRDVGEIFVEGTDRRFEMKRGDVWVVRWSAVRAWCVGCGTGDVELI